MEKHLTRRRRFCDDLYSIVDVARLAYTHIMHTLGKDLLRLPRISDWRTNAYIQRAMRPWRGIRSPRWPGELQCGRCCGGDSA